VGRVQRSQHGQRLGCSAQPVHPVVLPLDRDGPVVADPAGEFLLAGIREVLYQRSLPLATQHLRIVQSTTAGSAGVLGAASMAIEHVLSPEAIEAARLALDA
jgi:hypothetical protein